MPKTFDPSREITEGGKIDFDDKQKPGESVAETVLQGFKKALKARRAIRAYDGRPIPEITMRDCLRDATLAPSSSNLQTYELYWIREPEKKGEIVLACPGQPAAASAGELLVVVARGDLWARNLEKLISIMSHGGKKPLPEALENYYNRTVPFLMREDRFGVYDFIRRIVFWRAGQRKPTVRTPVNKCDHRIYAHIQSSMAAQTLMLSLAAHGYDSCPIGSMDRLRIEAILDLPRQAEVTMVIAAGHGKAGGLYGPRVRLPEADLIKEV